MTFNAKTLLKTMLGEDAEFRDEQDLAIESVVAGNKTLVVQRTGWGKSIVYFIATKILRSSGNGPTLLISPLLSLMRNQIESAARIGVVAKTINSSNQDEWDSVEESLQNMQCDILIVSPETLSSERFHNNILPLINPGIGMFVVDEAHCISDWGHDFRPDFRRIVRIVKTLPVNTPILATTATANDRVVEDIKEQLGGDLKVLRGPLTRESLRIQVIKLEDQSERLAWLSENLPKIDGSGIIYCLTIADCKRVARWLQKNGINALEYHSKIQDGRIELEQKLINNEVKVLVATVSLSMGFDKPDLGFVIHYQRPGSLVAYYQQIGRAGRNIETAYAILLNGGEDDVIQEYFINTAFPSINDINNVLEIIAERDSITLNDLLKEVNLSQTKARECLKVLEIDGLVAKAGTSYFRTLNPWIMDEEHSKKITELRHQEMGRIKEYVDTNECYMKFVAMELDDSYAKECGKCANCVGSNLVPATVSRVKVLEAISYLRGDCAKIKVRKMWPAGGVGTKRGKIREEYQNEEGRSLSIYGDAGWGRCIIEDRYEHGLFRDDLVNASVDFIKNSWKPDPMPEWVTAVPSLRHPDLVPGFTEKVAKKLGLPFHPIIVKNKETQEQKSMRNSAQQASNIVDAFSIDGECPSGTVLLIDDIINSGWTFTVCGVLLRENGSGRVFPFALSSTASGGDND